MSGEAGPRTIELDHLTKIEGHASLVLKVRGGRVEECRLSSVEGARYFEGILRGRPGEEAFEVSSRICGICSCAHVVAAITAVERAVGLVPSEQTLELRRLLTLGERVRSHATHLYFLALPDYLGAESALALLPAHKDKIQRALRLMKVGNAVISAIGGRDLHPVSASVGGFHRIPDAATLRGLADSLEAALPDAEETVRLFQGFDAPSLLREREMFSLSHGRCYAMLSGTMRSQSHEFPQDRYLDFLSEYHNPHSTANFVVAAGKAYMVGALSRLNNNRAQLMPRAQALLAASGIPFPSSDPFRNNFAQAIELVHCIEDAARIARALTPAPEPVAKLPKRAGRGVAAIEVPRGTLWHEYVLSEAGIITQANIITPTAQNLRSINEDIELLVPRLLHLSREEIVLAVEKLIRSYDPCFSCSSHFLDVKWE